MKKSIFWRLLIGVIIGFGLTNCSMAVDGSDAELAVNLAEKRNCNIYFIGNSITFISQCAEAGWYGNWGMAASRKENDYVHKLIGKLSVYYNSQFTINYGLKMVSNWEENFFVELADPEINNIDILVVRLGENVDEEYAQNNNYYDALDKLIKKYKAINTKVIITDNYWPSNFKDEVQKSIAINNGYYFVQINDLYGSPKNSAFGQFVNPGVAAHPSDIGMERIAQRIFDYIKENNIMN